jgi:hypothetical protein
MLFKDLTKERQQKILDESFDLDIDGVSLGSKGEKEHFDYWNESIYQFDDDGELIECEDCNENPAIVQHCDYTRCKECQDAQDEDDARWR